MVDDLLMSDDLIATQSEPDSDTLMIERDSVAAFRAPDPEPEDTRPQQLQRALYGPRTVKIGLPLLGDLG